MTRTVHILSPASLPDCYCLIYSLLLSYSSGILNFLLYFLLFIVVQDYKRNLSVGRSRTF